MNLTPIDQVTSAGEARDLAVQYSHLEHTELFELVEGQHYFEQLVQKFPELREEFEENAII